MNVCKHGLPTSWEIGSADWREDRTLLQTITVHCCTACVEEGTAAALIDEIKRMVQRHIEDRLGDKR